VAIITTVHSAGDARIFHKQAQTLARAGWDVTLLAPGVGRQESGAAPDRFRVLSAEFRVQSSELRVQSASAVGVGRPRTALGGQLSAVGLSVPRGRLLRMTVGAARALAATLRTRSDVCHFHDPELLPVGLVLKALGKHVVYDVHEDYPEQILAKGYIPLRLRRVVAGTFDAVEKWAARRLDAVVAATDAIAGKFSGARAVTVRNYPMLDVARATPGATGVRREASGVKRQALSAPSAFRLVHLAGTLTEERGVSMMVQAMELLGPGFELVLAGRFVPAQLELSLRRMPGFGSVRLLPAVPHERVWDVYAECDAGLVCLLPVERYKVSLPVKLFEFMAAGLPVVASDFPLFREIVEGSGAGVCVDSTDPAAIAAACRRLAGRPAECGEMGRRGMEAVRERFSWEAEARTLVGLYAGLGGRPPDALRSTPDATGVGRPAGGCRPSPEAG
jgi:glycosyltransferase involved in cell wall biosynthesis